MGFRGLRDHAEELLERIADGESIDRDEAQDFARAWLDGTGGELALSFLTARDFEARKLIDLCSFVLDAVEEEEATAAPHEHDGGPKAAGGES